MRCYHTLSKDLRTRMFRINEEVIEYHNSYLFIMIDSDQTALMNVAEAPSIAPALEASRAGQSSSRWCAQEALALKPGALPP